jgi:hypothetical protein
LIWFFRCATLQNDTESKKVFADTCLHKLVWWTDWLSRRIHQQQLLPEKKWKHRTKRSQKVVNFLKSLVIDDAEYHCIVRIEEEKLKLLENDDITAGK